MANFSGVHVTRSTVCHVCFVDRCLSFCLFFFLAIVLFVLLSFWPLCCLFFCLFGHCVVCSSVFWSLCCLFFCLLVIVLFVLLSFGHCVVCSSVFWPLCCLFFFNLRILITPLVSSNSS